MTTEEVIEKLDDMYHSDSPFMYGRRTEVKEAIEMLQEFNELKRKEEKRDAYTGIG